MSGDTRRIGVLVPPGNVAVEAELPSFLPPNVRMHTGRLYRKSVEVTYDGHLEMLRSVEQAARGLAQAGVEVILFCCTSASFMQGAGKDREIASQIGAITGIPAVATATAVVEALEAVGGRRIYMVTPYTDDFNALEVQFIRDHDMEVLDCDTIPCRTTVQIRAIPPEDVASMVLKNRAKADAADAIFVSCTNLHSMDQIDRLEAMTGKPVITSNSATLWAGLQRMDIDGGGMKAGRLFESTSSR